ncbi:MAG: hypothetical protein ACKOTH_00850 [Solirubrobacterales bacterium]
MADYEGMAVERDGDTYLTRRESREALVLAGLDFGPRREPQLATTLAFFDHMLEMLGWYGDFVVDALRGAHIPPHPRCNRRHRPGDRRRGLPGDP